MPAIIANPENLEARSEALYGAWLCGVVLGSAGMALHHKLCWAGASTCRTPRRIRSCCRTPCATTKKPRPKRWLASRAPFRAEDPAAGIYDLEKSLGLPLRLADIGMKEGDLERAARIATEAPYPNPRKVDYAGVLGLLQRLRGHRP